MTITVSLKPDPKKDSYKFWQPYHPHPHFLSWEINQPTSRLILENKMDKNEYPSSISSIPLPISQAQALISSSINDLTERYTPIRKVEEDRGWLINAFKITNGCCF